MLTKEYKGCGGLKTNHIHFWEKTTPKNLESVKRILKV